MELEDITLYETGRHRKTNITLSYYVESSSKCTEVTKVSRGQEDQGNSTV